MSDELTCDCCGTHQNVGTFTSKISNILIELCTYCQENRHEPKWLLDEIVDEQGGLEFCKSWLRKMVQGMRYCVVREE